MKECILIDQNGVEFYSHVVIADNFMSRLRGLMFVSPGSNRALLISPCSSVHTFWMRFSLDIVFLGKDGAVLRIVENAPPRRIYSCLGATTVLECESGFLPLQSLSDNSFLSIKI